MAAAAVAVLLDGRAALRDGPQDLASLDCRELAIRLLEADGEAHRHAAVRAFERKKCL